MLNVRRVRPIAAPHAPLLLIRTADGQPSLLPNLGQYLRSTRTASSASSPVTASADIRGRTRLSNPSLAERCWPDWQDCHCEVSALVAITCIAEILKHRIVGT
jgi:hypothetical protein